MRVKLVPDASGRKDVARLVTEEQDPLTQAIAKNPLMSAMEQMRKTTDAILGVAGGGQAALAMNISGPGVLLKTSLGVNRDDGFRAMMAAAGDAGLPNVSVPLPTRESAGGRVKALTKAIARNPLTCVLEQVGKAASAVKDAAGGGAAAVAMNLPGPQVPPEDPLPANRAPMFDELREQLRNQHDVFESIAEEKRARLDREVQTLEEIRAIHRELKAERLEREKLAEALQRHDEELTRLRSGAPGRPTAMHLVEAEFDRRIASRDLEDTVTEQGQELSTWLTEAHPDAARLTGKAIENRIRARFRDAKRAITRAALPKRSAPRRSTR